MNHTATHKADSHKSAHTDTEDFRKHTRTKRAMGCPWGEGQRGGCGSRSTDDSVLMERGNIYVFVSLKTTSIALFHL